MTLPDDYERLIGGPADALPTPCLVVDPEALDDNLAHLAGYFAGRRCRLRPHFKSHKCVAMARRQLAAGSAAGITCAKLSEAERLVEGGIDDILIANQVVGEGKVRRLAALNRQATVRVAVDAPENVAELGRIASEAGVEVGVLVEVDIGMNRCGVPPGRPVLDLARRVAAADALRFDGLQAYEGHCVGLRDPAERRRHVLEAFKPLIETRRLIENAGLPVRIVSSGGTGTYDVTGNIDGVDEVQCGSYALMDAHYRTIRAEFRIACRLMATVISARPGKAVVDVGVKGMGCEFGPPAVDDHPEAVAVIGSEEHTRIEGINARVGDRLWLVPSHGCTTSNLHGRFWVVRGGTVEAMWPIEGRGCLE